MRTIITRQGWDARPAKGGRFTPIRRKVQGIVVHHSGVKNGPQGVAAVKAFERFHMDTRGWRGIAYNWLVDEQGVVYEGRGGGVVSGATRGWNSRTESICYTGYGFDVIPAQALAAIEWLISDIQRRYGGDLWVKGHRDLGKTSCPGSKLYAWLQDGMPNADPQVEQPSLDLDTLERAVNRGPLSRRRRSRGEPVRVLQRYLLRSGYPPGPVDGVFGRQTDTGVRRFQGSAGLKVDGIVGRRTMAAIRGR